MSALGQKRTLGNVAPMSALPPKAGIGIRSRHTKADILRCSKERRYSITSSAVASSVCGNVKPNVLARLCKQQSRTDSDAEAQVQPTTPAPAPLAPAPTTQPMPGMQHDQEQQTGGKKRRQARHTGRMKRREARHNARTGRREARHNGRTMRREARGKSDKLYMKGDVTKQK